MDFFIPDLHGDLRDTRLTRRGATHDPNEVPMWQHKEYPRMLEIVLPKPHDSGVSLADALKRRSSYDGGTENSKLSLEDCGTLLGAALGKREDGHRNYPSGGALYPIETYLLSLRLEGQAPAAFHYNPTKHALEKLWDLPQGFDFKSLVQKPDDLLFSSLIIFTGIWKRSSAKYGDFSYTVALLEAGHMSENALLVATAIGLHARPMAGFNDDRISSILDLDPAEEQPVHTITLS